MSGSLDISLHGSHRVEIIERLVHICRYSPGLVYLVGEPGKSPVVFLHHMADLLRDELDFALLGGGPHSLQSVCSALIKQWFVYRGQDDLQTDSQSLHHFLDVGAQGRRMALVVVERTTALDDDALDFLVALMARHSCLTVLFSGVLDSRSLLRRAQQFEIPVHRIELPDAEERAEMSRQDPARNREQSREDDLFGYDNTGTAEPPLLTATRHDYTSRTQRVPVDAPLGVSARLAAIRTWGAETFAGLQRRRSSGMPLLIVSVAALGALLLVGALYYPGETTTSTSAVIATPVPAVARVVDDPARQELSLPVQGGVSQSSSASLPPAATSVGSGAVTAIAPPPVVGTVPAAVPVQSEASTANVSTAAVAVPPKPVIRPSGEMPAEVKPVEKLPQVLATATHKPAAATKVVSKSTDQSSLPKDWRSQPRGNYTVQLAAAYGEASVKGLAAKLPKTQPHYIYKTQRDGKPWFVLIYGSFASKEAAEVARKQLDASLKGQSTPWVRKLGDVLPK